MGRRPSPDGYSASRYNRMSNGVMLHRLLPSRGLDSCPLSEGCPCWDEDIQRLCVPGEPCPWETLFLNRYVESGRRNLKRCLQWMNVERRDSILHELGILSLRRRRLSALLAREGLVRPKRHPVSGFVYGVQATVGVGRYMTAIANQFNPLMDELILSPDERLERDKEEAPDDGPIDLALLRPVATPQESLIEPAPEPFVNPTEGWFELNKPWEHQPGNPRNE